MSFKTTCPLDCFDGCSIEVDENLNLKGEKEHPITRGFLCHHLVNYHKFERIEKPSFQNKEISLEKAIEILTQKLKEADPKKTLYFKGSGNLGSLQSLPREFFTSYGSDIATGSLCEDAGAAGIEEGRGANLSLSPLHVAQSDVVILWGRNPSITNSHMLPALKNKTLIVIDPLKTDLAKNAAMHLQIKPRGDIYLAMLLARNAYMQEMEDEEFIENRCENFDYFIEFVNSIPMRKLMDECGINLVQVNELLEIIKDKKVSFLVGLGVQKYTHGHSVLRAIDSFAAMLGLFGKSGCGVGYIADSAFGFKSATSKKKKEVTLPTVDFGNYDVVFIQGANPMAQMPCTPKVKEGLEKAKFVVYFGLHVNQTSLAADLIIPAKTFLEKEDLKLSYGHEYIGYMPKIVDSKIGISEYELAQELLQNFGFERLKSEKEYIDEIVFSNSMQKGDRLISKTYETLPYEKKFYTSSGKFEFFDEYYDDFTSEKEFFLLTVKQNKSLNSQFIIDQFLYVPTHLNLQDGMSVELDNGESTCKYIIKNDARLRKDCLLIYSGHKDANALTPHKVSQEGKCAVFQELKVDLRICDE